MPGRAGNYFYTPGFQFAKHPAETHLWKSINGGLTWSSCFGVNEAWSVGLGLQSPTAMAIQRSTSTVGFITLGACGGATMAAQLGSEMSNLYPADTVDEVRSIEGDANVYGNVYLGLVGSGWIYGKLN